MTRISIKVESAEREALVQFAATERRDPRDQAALIIRQRLEQLGLLLPTPLPPAQTPPPAKERQR